ncbi:hypothetical protein GCM10022226_58570 [Sphaerisporangium flaviroseum]|uniref:Glycosyltransferase RgtA/B/C/D-like domain-containing protein n=1 Tax=Sphaerisporangium flaviroseum TaxID=509199 RepID=A0ABP7IY58_9ACTN
MSADRGWGEAMRVHQWARWAPAPAGLVVGALALGPALGPGFVLRYDMVFVPDPPVTWPVGGFPRAVPSDLVVALLAHVMPALALQKLILIGIFVLAGCGAAALVPGDRLVPRLAAAVFYAWNAYLAQRLLLGQWALLLGFAGLPWAVRAAARGGPWRLALALVPAAVGGFQAMLVSALAVLPVAATRPSRRLRGVLEALAVLGTLSLPWAVPALLSQAATDPAGVDAFAARADGPFGTLGSLVSLGGIWNAEAEVPGQAAWPLATARLLLAAVAVVTFVRLPWTRDRAGETTDDGGVGTPFWRGLLIAAAVGLAIASTGAYAPGVLKAMIGFWPGFGPLRDGQLYVAPLVLVQAIGFGVFAGRCSRPSPRGGRAAVVVPGVVAVLVPLLVLPAFAWGASGRLAAVEYPDEWRRVQAIVNRDPRPGALISLPWGAHRAFAWNGGRVILDPATKSFARRVIWNDALVVGLGRRGSLRLRGEDFLGRRIGMVITARNGPLTQVLRAAGIRYVLITGRNENRFRSRLPGAVPAFVGNEVLLLRL